MTIHTPPVNVPALDLSANTPETGDTVAFPSKMTGAHGQIEQFNSDVITSFNQSIAAMEALSDAIEANTAALMSYDEKLIGLANSQQNLFPDHGALIPDTGTYLLTDGAAAFDISGFQAMFATVNATDPSTMLQSARHYFDSSVYGGAGTADNAVAQLFMDAMNPNSKRYAPAFAVGFLTIGSGSEYNGFSGVIGFLNFVKGRGLVGVNNNFSISFYVRPISTPIYVRGFLEDSARDTYINGVRLDVTGGVPAHPDYHEIAAGDVAHVCFCFGEENAPRYNYLDIFGSPGAAVQMAAFTARPGRQQIRPHGIINRSQYVPT